ncbi:hypothetical protein GCM10008066_02830 [Oxalicibacterium faecigallinarum]|uniref:Uncharacterized protein n=1 Tax=Oxalicibacterium faecigallinarum TaxID=573741 RepID=A0A8J3AKE8_9BURK|nr:hypothetical protein GCM10008066_02830 [Oxalicibacterium faecigallinarum]
MRAAHFPQGGIPAFASRFFNATRAFKANLTHIERNASCITRFAAMCSPFICMRAQAMMDVKRMQSPPMLFYIDMCEM